MVARGARQRAPFAGARFGGARSTARCLRGEPGLSVPMRAVAVLRLADGPCWCAQRTAACSAPPVPSAATATCTLAQFTACTNGSRGRHAQRVAVPESRRELRRFLWQQNTAARSAPHTRSRYATSTTARSTAPPRRIANGRHAPRAAEADTKRGREPLRRRLHMEAKQKREIDP